MVASHAVMEQGPQTDVLDLSASMEAYAAAGEWDKVEELAGKLRSAVMAVPEEHRREALQVAHRAVEEVQDRARTARGTIAEKLSVIRRGKDATKAYARAE